MSSSSKEFPIEIHPRLKSNKNSTHDSLVDSKIKSTYLYKTDPKKQKCALLSYIFSFGIIKISTFIWNKLFIYLECIPSQIDDATYVLIIDIYNKTTVIPLTSSPFSKENTLNQNSIYYPRKENLSLEE